MTPIIFYLEAELSQAKLQNKQRLEKYKEELGIDVIIDKKIAGFEHKGNTEFIFYKIYSMCSFGVGVDFLQRGIIIEVGSRVEINKIKK